MKILEQHCASFDSPAPRSAQDEVLFFLPVSMGLILSRRVSAESKDARCFRSRPPCLRGEPLEITNA